MKSTRSKVLAGVATVAALLLGLLLAIAFARLFTEYQWYRSLDQQSVYTVRLVSRALLWAAASAFAFGILYLNARMAQRLVEMTGYASKVVLGAVVALSMLAGLSLSAHWMTFRLAAAQAPFGLEDPLFGKDVGFFVFTLPALELLGAWANGLVVLAVIVVLGIVLVPSRPGVTAGLSGSWWKLKSVMSVLLGFLTLWAGFNYWISIWGLSISSGTQISGASYTDVHARIPALWILATTSIIVAGVLFATARSRRWTLLVTALSAWALLALTLGTVWPTVVQTYSVAPNEAARELPYIARNIKMTREAFALTPVRGTQYSAVPTLTPEASTQAVAALTNARIWTPSTVKRAYTQLQTIRPYYRLSNIDTDRYVVNGEPQQVLVAAREVDTSSLPKRAQTWVNQHLVYTHGYGMVIGSASTATGAGFPQMLVGDVPPATSAEASDSPELETTQPRVYFGPDTTDYAVVNTGIDEFDYPLGETNVTCRNKTGAGVSVGSLLSRVAWAMRLGSDQLIFSDYIKPDSRILMNRDVASRVTKLAPWLSYDKHPYPALVDGRITWILDAYTSSDHYPYSQPLSDGTNYLRNSVKVTVDALTGETTFYAFGDDPIRDAWAKIFPSVITPATEMTPSLVRHLRYPKRFLSAQADIYRTYHMTDPTVFYNEEDLWQTPDDNGGRVEPSYLMLDLPDSPAAALYLMQPYEPSGGDNMIGWMAASCGPAEYGRQTVYLLPKERVVLSAQQVRAQINQDPTISPQLSLWNQRGSKVLFGEMLVLPVADTVTYIQPIFLQAEENAISELVGVVAVNGDHVEMGGTLSAALTKAFPTAQLQDREDVRLQLDELLDELTDLKRESAPAPSEEKLRELKSAVDELATPASADSL